VPPAVPGFAPGRSYPLDADLRAARRLAGGRKRQAVLWYCTNGVFGGTDQGRIAALLRSQLSRIRMSVSITTSDCNQDSLYDAASRGADLIMFGGGSPERDPMGFLDAALADGAYGSAIGPGPWRAPAFRRRVERARALRDDDRVAQYRRLVDELMRAAPIVVYGSFVAPEYFGRGVGCKVFQPALGFVDLGTICAPTRRP